MAGGDEFFDEFGAGRPQADQALLSEGDFQRLRSLFLDTALSLEELHGRYRRALEDILASQGRTVEWAQAEHGHYPYVAAYSSPLALDLVRSEAVAADRECGAMSAKECWEPPPPDAEPETAHDYE